MRGGALRRAQPTARLRVIVPSGVARPTSGGYRVTGQWVFTSGSHHANLFTAGVTIVDEAGSPRESE